MTFAGSLHVIAAVLAFGLGLVVLSEVKGTRRHRRLGHIFVGLMLVVNLAALTVYEDTDGFGPFHWLALVSLASLGLGIGFIRYAARGASGVIFHAHWMVWSVAGLAAAAAGQAVTWLGYTPLPTILVMLGLTGGLIVGLRLNRRAARYRRG